MTRDPYGVPPENRTVPRFVQGAQQPARPPVEPPPRVQHRVQPGAPPAAPPPPPPWRRELDPDRWGHPYAPPPAVPIGPPPGAPPVPGSSSRRRWAAFVVAILVTAAAIVVGVVLTSAGNATSTPAPSTVVRTYLTDLAAGNADGALAQGPAPRQRYFLTDDVLREQQQLAPITDIEVRPATIDGDHAQVQAQYRFGSRTADMSYTLTQSAGRWQLDRTTFSIDVSSLGNIPSVSVFDKPLGDVQTIDVFPGPVQWSSGNKYFLVSQRNAAQFALSPTDPNANRPDISTSLNAAGVAAIRSAAAAYVRTCAASRALQPRHCPQSEFGLDGAVPDSASWTVTTKLYPALRVMLGDDTVTTITVEANLRWTCVYSVRVRAKTTRVTDRTVVGPMMGSVDLTAAQPVFVPES